MFCNPPYGRQINEWVRKGYEESKKPGTLVVMLIPARTDTSYFHDYIFHGKADEVRFIRGRLTFTDEDGNPTKDAKGRPCSAPFPSAVVIWRSKDMAQSLRDMVLDLIRDRDMTANEIAATLSDRGQQVSRSDVGPILTKAQPPDPRNARQQEHDRERNHGRAGEGWPDPLLQPQLCSTQTLRTQRHGRGRNMRAKEIHTLHGHRGNMEKESATVNTKML